MLRPGRPRARANHQASRLAGLSLLVSLALVAMACGSATPPSQRGLKAAQHAGLSHPNIVVLLTDDQRYDAVDEMRWMSSQPGWATFTNSFVNDSQCCPSRSTILTGRLTQHTGVETLEEGQNLDETTTIATMLHNAGYRTGEFGKYLNNYPFGRGNYIPPGWDDWNAYEGSTNYSNYVLNQNGKRVRYGTSPAQYSTTVLTKLATKFIASTPSSKPLFLYLPYNAPHYVGVGWAVPAVQDKGACQNNPAVRPPDYNVTDKISDPPWLVGAKPMVDWIMQSERQAVCETLRSVDRSVEAVVHELARTNRLDDTYIMFASDNGYDYGEHKLVGKGDLYEPSIRVPLMVRGPGITTRNISRLTSNIDWTPSLLDLAHVSPPKGFKMDGTSFAGNLFGQAGTEPQAVLLRGCRTLASAAGVSGGDGEGGQCGGYPTGFGLAWGLRTSRYKYVEYSDGSRQLFDLTKDPYELSNIVAEPSEAAVVQGLHTELTKMEHA